MTVASQNSFQGIQSLRLIAALMVVVTHATFFVGSRLDPSFKLWNDGAQGVAIFFVISGFVMMLSSRPLLDRPDGYRTFIVNRIIRIVPVYWLVNIAKLAIWILVPASVFASADPLNIVLSFLFVPARDAKGAIEPFYGVGWTLNFEMFFYALFALSIYMGRKPLLFVGGTLCMLSLVSLFKSTNWPTVGFYANPIILNFLYGMIIAELLFHRIRVPKSLALVCTLVGAAIIFLQPGIRILGIQYALFVGGVIFLESRLKGHIPKAFVFGGDISYSLYLVHPMIGPAVTAALVKVGISNPYLAIGSIVATSIAAATILYVGFESPVTRRLKKIYPSNHTKVPGNCAGSASHRSES